MESATAYAPPAILPAPSKTRPATINANVIEPAQAQRGAFGTPAVESSRFVVQQPGFAPGIYGASPYASFNQYNGPYPPYNAPFQQNPQFNGENKKEQNTEEEGAPPGFTPAKMFVGGLPQSVTSETLRDNFARYGPIVEAFVLMDETSGRSRGFGFVSFQNQATLDRVLACRPHFMDGKLVDCKHAVMKGQIGKEANQRPPQQGSKQPSPSHAALLVPSTTANHSGDQYLVSNLTFGPAPSFSTNNLHCASGPYHSHAEPTQPPPTSFDDDMDGTDEDLFLTGGGKSYLALSGDKWLEDCAEADERKIFVGGLPDVTPAEFAGFFEHLGPVSDAMVMFDRKRRRQRGFGFITFATEEGVQNALKHSRHPVKGKLVEVKKAHPLVLQKARAPARREREQQMRAASKRTHSQPTQSRQSAIPSDPFALSHVGSKAAASEMLHTYSIQPHVLSQARYPQAPWWQHWNTPQQTPTLPKVEFPALELMDQWPSPKNDEITEGPQTEEAIVQYPTSYEEPQDPNDDSEKPSNEPKTH